MLMKLAAPSAISIHALHEESDDGSTSVSPTPPTFQSTLSMRRATIAPRITVSPTSFQSTLSMRRATLRRDRIDAENHDFNPRSP